MSESSQRVALPSSSALGTIVPRKFPREKLSKFGKAVVALADGIKPGQWLADRVKEQGGKCTERHANLIIEGKRKPNARAALAVYAEIIG